MKEFEVFQEEFSKLSVDIKINIYNRYAENNGLELVYPNSEFSTNMLFYGYTYYEMLKIKQNSHYNIQDKWILRIDKYKIQSFDNHSINKFILSKIKRIFDNEWCWSEYIDRESIYDNASFLDKEDIVQIYTDISIDCCKGNSFHLDKNINIFHFLSYIEEMLCDEFNKFCDLFYKSESRIQLNICYKFAMNNNLDIIWKNKTEDIEKIKAIHHISNDEINTVLYTHCGDEWLFKDKHFKKPYYRGYDYSDYESLFNNIFDIFSKNSELIFKDIFIWRDYIPVYSVFKYYENYEYAYSKACFKVDYLKEYLFTNDILGINYEHFKFYMENFHNMAIFDFGLFDDDFLLIVRLFFNLRKRCPWADIKILKWYLFKMSDKNGYISATDICEDFIYNYKEIREKFYNMQYE